MPNNSLSIEQVLTLLAGAPPRIAALTSGLSSARLRTPPNPAEWSANDVLAHLRSCADVWGNCIEAILTHDRPTLRAVNPRTWIEKTDYREQKFQPSLQEFTKQRTDLMKILETLAPEDWARTATVTSAGNVLERSVLFYARWLATHERPHLKQIERIANTMHR